MRDHRPEILTHVLEQAPVQVWGVDRELKLIYLDGGAVRDRLDRPPEEWVGKPLESILGEEARWVLQHHRAAFEGVPQDYEVKWRGTVFWVHLNPPTPDEPDEVRGTALDITRLHDAHERAREAEEIRAFAVQAAGAGYWHLDLDPEVPDDLGRARLYLSPRVLDFIGFGPGEGPGTVGDWHARILDRDLPLLTEAAAGHLAGRDASYQVEYRIRHRDGSLRWIRSHGRIGRDREGRPVRWAGLDFDVTDERRLGGRWGHLFANLTLAALYHDANGVVTAVNARAETLLGVSASDLVGQRPSEMSELFRDPDGQPLPPDAHPPLVALRERRVVQEVEWWIRPDEGAAPRRFLATSVPRIGPEGEPLEVFTLLEKAVDSG